MLPENPVNLYFVIFFKIWFIIYLTAMKIILIRRFRVYHQRTKKIDASNANRWDFVCNSKAISLWPIRNNAICRICRTILHVRVLLWTTVGKLRVQLIGHLCFVIKSAGEIKKKKKLWAIRQIPIKIWNAILNYCYTKIDPNDW